MANEELYNSYLFRKSHKKFLVSFLIAFLGDFMPLDDIGDDIDIPIPGLNVTAGLSDPIFPHFCPGNLPILRMRLVQAEVKKMQRSSVISKTS
jgi:hypothetical protein